MKRTKILSLFLALILVLTAIPMTVLAAGEPATAATPTLPETLPGNPSTIYRPKFNGTDAYDWSDTTTALGSDGTMPATTYGIKYSMVPAMTEAEAFTTTNVTDNVYYTLASAATIPAGATGFMVRITNATAATMKAFCFNPVLSGTAYLQSTQSKYAAYYYDEASSAWRAVTKAEYNWCIRFPGSFDGYFYIPFESIGLTSATAKGLSFTGFGYRNAGWNSDTDTTYHSVSIVTADLALNSLPGDPSAIFRPTLNSTFDWSATDTALGVGGTMPASTYGMTYTTLPAMTEAEAFSTNLTTDNVIYNLETGTFIPEGSTGFMVRVTNGATGAMNAFVFNPVLNGTTYLQSTQSKFAAYYCDASSFAWRAVTKDEYAWCIRFPGSFDGYFYIPFESIGLTSETAAGMKFTGFGYRIAGWDTTSQTTYHSVSIVAKEGTEADVRPMMPTTLPADDGTVYKAGYDGANMVFNNANYTVNTTYGPLAAGAGTVPAAAESKPFTLSPAYTTSVTHAGTATGDTGAEVVEGLSVPVPANAQGFMLKVSMSRSSDYNNGIGFSPAFTDVTYRPIQSSPTHCFYYFDADTQVWRASVGDWWVFRMPGQFNGYVYIPFENYFLNDGSAMTAEDVAGRNFTGFKYFIGGTAGAFTIESVSFVIPAGLTGTNLTINNNLNVNVYASAGTSADATLKVTSANAALGEQILTSTWDATNNAYRFTFKNVLPQMLTEDFTYTLMSGETVIDSFTQSVRDYCDAVLATETNAYMINLIVDVLRYGAAAQTVAGYKTELLATDGLDAKFEDFGTSSADKVVNVPAALTDSTDAGKTFASANVRLEDAVALRLYLTLDTVENVTVSVKLGDGEAVVYNGADLVKSGAYYTLVFGDIYATKYDTAITADILVNGASVQTLTYSINAYLADVAGDTTVDADMRALIDAVYSYGASASDYLVDLANF